MDGSSASGSGGRKLVEVFVDTDSESESYTSSEGDLITDDEGPMDRDDERTEETPPPAEGVGEEKKQEPLSEDVDILSPAASAEEGN